MIEDRLGPEGRKAWETAGPFRRRGMSDDAFARAFLAGYQAGRWNGVVDPPYDWKALETRAWKAGRTDWSVAQIVKLSIRFGVRYMILHGPTHRVKIRIHNEIHPETLCKRYPDRPTWFVVQYLDQRHPTQTSFSTGEPANEIYRGTKFLRAWALVEQWLERPVEIPDPWRVYLPPPERTPDAT